jgi:excisionase family DNA binding protein
MATGTGSSSSDRRRPLLTVGEAAALLTVDADTVRRWIEKGAMRALAVGPHHRLRITPAEVARHLRPYAGPEA